MEELVAKLMGLTTAEKIASAALLVSVASFLFNFFYTRRKFFQSSDPEVNLVILRGNPGREFGPLDRGIFGFEIKNLHSAVTITDLRVFVWLRKFPRRFDPRGRRWRLTHKDKLDPIDPKEEPTYKLDERDAPVVKGVAKYFPGYVETKEKSQTYRLLKEEVWEVRLQIRYRGGVIGARKRKVEARLQFTPVADPHGDLARWESKRLK